MVDAKTVMNGDSSHASETSPVEVTKKGIRSGIFKQVRRNQYSAKLKYNYYNCIPWFTDSDDPVNKLKELDLFKNAENVLVGYDKAQESIKLACLEAKKTLYVQVPYLQKYLMTRLKLEDDATEATFREALTLKGLEKYGKVIGIDDKVEIDLVILGSVAASKDGVRIGRGGGNVDLYLAVLSHLKLIQPHTTIMTTVHDSQLIDIPNSLIGPHDYPVDIIVTPTQVIHTSYQKPSGILWNLISPTKLKYNSLVSHIREKEMQKGELCELKADTDNERERENGGFRRYYHRNRWANNRRWQGPRYRKQTNGVHSESEQYEPVDGESADANKHERPQRRTYFYRKKRPIQAKDNLDTGKSLYRNKAWQSLRANRATTTLRRPYDRIPGFKGAQVAAQSLRSLDVFQKAKNVLVSIERLHEGIRLACLEEGKGLYLLNPVPQKQLIMRVQLPEGDEKPDLKTIVSQPKLYEYGVKLEPEEELSIDLWVVGSVAISKEGQHIGKGNGSIDLCYAYMMEKKIINDETTIITTVHDHQIFDTLPAELFGEHDIPVHMIVTPTQVINIERDPKKTHAGIMWNMINPRVLNRLPFLADFREKEIANGNPCVLKEESSDVESGGRRKKDRSARSNDMSESEHNDMGEAEGGIRNRKKRFGNPHRRYQKRNTNDLGENEVGGESGNISPDTTTRHKRHLPFHRPMTPVDFSIKLSSIDRVVRVRDLKNALIERKVKPTYITWKGYKGYCFLHFAKSSSPSGEGESDLTPESIIHALAELTLQPSEGNEDSQDVQPNKVSVELMKPSSQTRIETADETAV